PSIDDVSYQVQVVGLVPIEKFKQLAGPASPGPQMEVGDPDGTKRTPPNNGRPTGNWFVPVIA
ncbi:MAG TPA: hypothetical protein VGY99_06520, partial [Candidatus Binataceae bacterium]|nr:hypothetical protein [Candidatus Binataceae bacterium]